MKNIWETCEFSEDITSSDFSNAKFAVELHEFLDKTADAVYQDPALFFANTFPTNQMKLLVKDSLVRLESGKGQPVTIINTGFGGGKTHSILLLHHIINSPARGLEFITRINLPSEYGVDKIPKAKMITIDCRKISKDTFWGEIADQLGEYEKFKDLDAGKIPVTDISILKPLFDEPVLLLIDELPQYLAKVDTIKIGNKTLADLTITFIMDLISVVSASEKSCMILTLTDKQKMYDSYAQRITSKTALKSKTMQDFRIDDIIENLGEAISRQTQVITPVQRSQIYDVVKARLVKKIDPIEREKTVTEYVKYYEKHGMPMRDAKERLTQSYPFHPSLIDTLYDRVSTIPNFNQTRGMFRLLARIIRLIVNEKPDCSIMGLSDVQLTNHGIADELTVNLGMKLRVVIDTDCIEHAQKLDESKRIKIVESIARAILVFSLHGHAKKSGIQRSEIKVAVGFPGLEPSLIDKALDEDIMENFWYIQDKDRREFYFVEFPNINAIIHEYQKEVLQEEVREAIRGALVDLLPANGTAPVIWDEYELKDDQRLKIFVIDYAVEMSESTAAERMERIIDRTGNGGIRTFKNTIIFVYVDSDSIRTLESHAKYFVAIKKAKKDERIHLNEMFLNQIKHKEAESKSQLNDSCKTAYSKIGYPNGIHPRLDEIRFMSSKNNTITDAVISLLESKGKLVRDISVEGIGAPEDMKEINLVYQSFKEDKSQPFLLNSKSFSEAIIEGVKKGAFGFCRVIRKMDDKYEAIINESDFVFEWDGYIVNKDKIYSKQEEITGTGSSSGTRGPPPPPPPPRGGGYSNILISCKL